ncbi:glutathione peroxidase [Rhodobacteraceae bacterium SC52]|nr:glutathione peroxidase [Rhodobacteraceae bacterium SC52]
MTQNRLACISATFIAFATLQAQAFEFNSIDGGTLDLDGWKGRPVLVVNTASLCGFTPQYEGLQTLFETYSDRGLIVLAVPSNDFRQELSGEEDVKDFCEVTFGLTIPMTEITHVRGGKAHPFYQWVAKEAGFTPRWNFNKVLLAPDGSVEATFQSSTRPMDASITQPIEAMLTQ